jgi:UDP-glucose 4-epimerase
MNILITGGAGYIGTHTIPMLAQIPQVKNIVVYDNLSHGRHGFFTGITVNDANVKFIRGEILDTRNLQQALTGIDLVIHLAAKVSTPFAHGDPHSFEQVNHWGSAELSYLLEESEVKKVIYVSSAAVYGLSDSIKSPSSTPHPNTWYGTSKLRAEKMLQRLQGQMDVITLRCANVYGYSPSIRFDAVINRFVRASHFEGRIQIEGDGQQYRPFVHIDRVSKIIKYCCQENLSGTFNLVDHNLKIWDVALELRERYPRLETIFIEQDMKRQSLLIEKSPVFSSVPTISLAENISEFTSHFHFGMRE